MGSALAIASVLALLGVLAWLAIRPYDKTERPWLTASFLAHMVAAIAMILVMQYYYSGGDLLAYHAFGTAVAARMRQDAATAVPMAVGLLLRSSDPVPFASAAPGSSTGALQGLSALLMYALGDSLYAACLLIAGLGFLAKIAMYNVFRSEVRESQRKRVLACCLLVPSVVFWSSGLLKEPLAMIGICFMFNATWRCLHGRWTSGMPLLLAGAYLTLAFKPYLVPPFGLAALLWLLLHRRRTVLSGRRLALSAKMFLAAAAVFLVVAGVGILTPSYAPDDLLEQAQRMQESGERVRGRSSYDLGDAGPQSPREQLTLLPEAVATAFFRPFVFEAQSPMVFINSLETLALTILAMVALAKGRVRGTLNAIFQNPTLAFCAVFALTVAVGVGLATTNLGALSRYRMPLVPFLAVFLVGLTSPSRPAQDGSA